MAMGTFFSGTEAKTVATETMATEAMATEAMTSVKFQASIGILKSGVSDHSESSVGCLSLRVSNKPYRNFHEHAH